MQGRKKKRQKHVLNVIMRSCRRVSCRGQLPKRMIRRINENIVSFTRKAGSKNVNQSLLVFYSDSPSLLHVNGHTYLHSSFRVVNNKYYLNCSPGEAFTQRLSASPEHIGVERGRVVVCFSLPFSHLRLTLSRHAAVANFT